MRLKINIRNVREAGWRMVCVLILFSGMVGSISAQQTPVYSQYMMDKFLINPALAGSEGYTTLSFISRQQWLGLANAPSTYSISGQSRLLRNSNIARSLKIRNKGMKKSRSGKVGIGANIFSDHNGIFTRTGAQMTYAYHITLYKSQLSFGLTGVAYQFRANTSNLTLDQQADPTIAGLKNFVVPDANFGAYYSAQSYYAGLSASQLFQSALKLGEPTSVNKYNTLRHYNLIAGYKYNIDQDYKIEPSIYIKTTAMMNLQADINAKVYFREDYWAGISYRTGSAIIFMAGIKVDNYYFGYSFDYTLTDIGRYTYGSHEIVFAAKFGDNARRYKWLNRY
jgi:type IX secretion system PorP/SprF family membrane protein